MSKRQWFVLLCIFVLYLLVGASIFFYVESKEEFNKNRKERAEKKRLEGLLIEHFQGNYSARMDLFLSLSEYCGKPFTASYNDDPIVDKWDFYHSLFFVITVVSTIGYGNLAPTTMFTRIFMIFYGLIGIPMNGIVIFTLGEFFGNSFTKLYQRWKKTRLDYDTAKLGLVGQVVLYLVPGFTFFVFLPSTIMTVFEGWEYDVSVYYAFVSLSTIGFGDYVAGVNDVNHFGPYYKIYQLFLLVWIIFGMGYLAMILSFISRGMRSKKIQQIEHMLSENIKPKKIREELRSILHELLFLKVKPIYKDEAEVVPPHTIGRSQSCPDLELYSKHSPSAVRKRAMSECYRSAASVKVQSDTDLDRIDKERTFGSVNRFLDQTGLLFKVVNALSAESLEEVGNAAINRNFELSATAVEEKPPPDPISMKPKRRRAISDIRPPKIFSLGITNDNTWYGADADHAIMEYRKRYGTNYTPEVRKVDRQNMFKRIRRRLMSRDETSSDVEKQDITRRRMSAPSTQQDNILEQTSIADFIRALSVVTSSEALIPRENNEETMSPKSRRQGIIANIRRRPSMISEVHPVPEQLSRRRFSLRPPDEDVGRKKEAIRKISFFDRRNSLLLEPSIPPTVEEHQPYTQQPPQPPQRFGESCLYRSTRGTRSGRTISPPPYEEATSQAETSQRRKFSVRTIRES
ncbi:open rectifier potassium channel protein 1 [Cylas formicarius]|uniref:open rectifier potassium channel protein 1 n=1 Tax=Cylas formicarius TaxID=197179 RepID=UPI002958B15C|nr:open rectifier potassium channel protein 1 [Cylas formicarius]